MGSSTQRLASAPAAPARSLRASQPARTSLPVSFYQVLARKANGGLRCGASPASGRDGSSHWAHPQSHPNTLRPTATSGMLSAARRSRRQQPLVMHSGAADATSSASASARGFLALPYSQQTTRALRAAKEQAARQGLMFAGPDQLLLGILAAADGGTRRGGGGGGGGGTAAARLLEAALGGGDADSVREWLNEQTGTVAPLVQGGGRGGSSSSSSGSSSGGVSSSSLRPSDVEFTAAAREVVRLAQAGAEAMGSRSVGSYHLLLVLLGGARWSESATASASEEEEEEAAVRGPGGALAGAEAASEPAGEELQGRGSASAEVDPGDGRPDDPPGGGSGGGSGGGGAVTDASTARRRLSGLLPALLRAVGADTAALQRQLLSLAERDEEEPSGSAGTAAAAYQDVVSRLQGVYQQQSALQQHQRDEAAFRMALPRGPPGAEGSGVASSRGQDDEEEDPYE